MLCGVGLESFECLPLRMGVAASEYVAGSATGGHIQIYTGYRGAATAQPRVESYQGLWDQQAHLYEHDVVIFSCEGQKTTGGNPGMLLDTTAQTYLMNYANAGGRVFASHYQYAWLNTGPFATGASNVATWTTGMQSIDGSQALLADIDTTVPGGAAFPEGSALGQWRGLVGALTANQLPIWFARNNVQTLAQPPSTEWIHLDAAVPKAPSPGRGNGGAMRAGVVPTDCAAHTLTPQEEALEFMLFDLSSCRWTTTESRKPLERRRLTTRSAQRLGGDVSNAH